MAGNSNRQLYFDFLRGFAIIMVVGIHTIKTNGLGFETVEDICTVLLRLILNCAVPLFLAISGYFVGKKDISFGRKHLEFLKHQIPKVYIPCLIFSIPYLLMALYSDFSLHGVLKRLAFFFACGFSIYYFIALIIQYYALLPLLTKCHRGGVIMAATISFASILIVTYVMKVLGIHPPLLLYAGPFPLWILFFVMGIYFSRTDRNFSILPPVLLTLSGFVFQILEYMFWWNRGQMALGIKISSFVFSAGVIWLLFSRKVENRYSENRIFNAVNWIGGISFGIYLTHCYWIIMVRKIYPDFNWIVEWTFVLCLTILMIWIVKKLLPGFSKRYLGFR